VSNNRGWWSEPTSDDEARRRAAGRALVVKWLGLIVAWTIAPVGETGPAAPVRTVGGDRDGVTRSSRGIRVGRKEGRFFARRWRTPEEVPPAVAANHLLNNRPIRGFMVQAPKGSRRDNLVECSAEKQA
jgi:hypothetical protein